MFKNTLLLLFLSISFILNAQQPEEASKNSIDSQFTELMESSNNYKNFKVVKTSQLNQLKRNTNKEIANLNEKINTSEATIQEQQKEITSLKGKLADIQKQLTDVTQEKDDIVFLGIATQKAVYKNIMWGLVFVLILILAFFIYQYKKSNSITKEARHKLQETEEEFEEYRKNALEKQQKLGRMLQDEKNKSQK
ncbi:peptidoglycan hydrolase CwlO-like protein [Mesonia hippocampi]|uniref:Peptidoglycan hydrolase CwlO-like protein n=1 Tax=Mesonia hippocampi TaxID=1628250 RepID=A0A840EH59_9FLAO|nr:hypothetical protein [Mesonia hippocampi]MBB4117769.1 peptidoglycan hydrolase CwlO-like protein [Mesonia hippocampi]